MNKCLKLLLCLTTAVAARTQQPSARARAPKASPSLRIVHVIVALADNKYQDIVPVPAAIGNGDDPGRNLYWGCGAGVRTWFRKSADWKPAAKCQPDKSPVLERCVFKHRREPVYLVADAYRGREIKSAVGNFFSYAAGSLSETILLDDGTSIHAGGSSDLIVYVGHDGLMDFALDRYRYAADTKQREVIILACASKQYFADALRWTGAKPLLWTTHLMAPEAYTLEAALAGWINKETGEQIRTRSADAYDKYQHCGRKAAHNLFASGW